MDLSALQSYDNTGVLLTGSDWCGEWLFTVVDNDGNVLVTETIPFTFDIATSIVTAAIETQLNNIGITGTLTGQPIADLSGFDIDLSTITDATKLDMDLTVRKCSDPVINCTALVKSVSVEEECCCENGISFTAGSLAFNNLYLTF